MDEITLTCEACGVRYRLGASAIPASGREVECSACGHMWFARPDVAPHTPDAPEPPPEQPRLTRPLSRDVLDILLGEVEHERKARAADQAEPPADEAEDRSDRAGSDSFWPATTLTDAPKDAAPHIAPDIPAPAPEALGIPLPQHDQPTEQQPVVEVQDVRPMSAPEPALVPALPTRLSSQPLISGSVPVRHTPEARAAAASYRSGMTVAAVATLVLMSLYLFAPALRNAGAPGAALVEARAEIDAGRIWLKQQVASLFVVEMQR